MLEFFRKHQRFFFIVITSVVVVSFVFFGTFNTAPQPQQMPDRKVVTGLDGKQIMQNELLGVCRLISTSILDGNSAKKGQMPNLFNDSVIEKDLISSGMAMILARRYFEELKPDLEKRLVRIKQFRPYAHPQNPQVCAEAIWDRFLPDFNHHLNALKLKSDQFTLETLAVLFQLYLDQAMMPADFLKQMLASFAQQQGLPQDPYLAQADLSLFGFHNLEDWFGPRFVQLAAQCIVNVGRLAKQQGYQVSNEAARFDLYQNIANNYRAISRQDQVDGKEIEAYYQNQLHHFGFDEKELLSSWKQVMLFRNLFHDVGNSVFLDPLPFEHFNRYAKEALQIDLYELPSSVHFHSLLDLCKFQTYLESVYPSDLFQKNPLAVPLEKISSEFVAKKAPSLVERSLEIEYARVDKQELMRDISLQQTWEWEVQEDSWQMLQKKFSYLTASSASSSNERYRILDQLSASNRLEVDLFARSMIIDQQPERVIKALDKASLQTETIGLKADGQFNKLFDRMANPKQLAQLLQKAPLRGEPLSEELNAVQNKLNAYSDNGETFYRIYVLKKENSDSVIPFALAARDGSLDRMLDKKLEAVYETARRKTPTLFQKADGSWKPFAQVKEELAKVAFSSLLKAIETANPLLVDSFKGQNQEIPASFYTQNRFYQFMSQAKKECQNNPNDSRWIANESETSQWKLLKNSHIVERSSSFSFAKEAMFKVPVGDFSPIEPDSSGSITFYRVVDKVDPKGSLADKTMQGHQLLSLDVQRHFFLELLDQIQKKQAIDLHVDIYERNET